MANTCVVAAYNVPANRTGCIIVGNKHGEQFEMNADFTNSMSGGGASCSCCEYRQFVRGVAWYRQNDQSPWTLVFHLLRWGIPLSPIYFYEDGFTNGGAYGYRAFDGGTDAFLPTRATGCQYRGVDFPGLTLPAGFQYTFALDFIGAIVDVCNNNTVVRSSAWTVACQGVV